MPLVSTPAGDVGAVVGQPAPPFALPAVQGGTIDLAAYRGQRSVVVWFSRGFTCPFCRRYMDSIIGGYQDLVAAEAEVIQVAPNLLEGARSFLRGAPVPYPFVCDPDKRLYAVYGLGDLGVLAATRTAVVSFAHAFTTGDGSAQIRGVVADIRNRNFVRRLHHHATTALEQGLFFVDKQGIVQHRAIFGPIESIPDAHGLATLTRAHCTARTLPAA